MTPRLYTALAVLKCVLAVALSPLIAVLFLVSKPAFIWAMTQLWPHLDIYTPEGKLYLRRFFMTPKTQWFRPRFLHVIYLSDAGRDPHDHPGPFSTHIFWNGYDEEIYFPHDFCVTCNEDHPLVGRPGNPFVRKVRAGETYENPEGHTHRVQLIGTTLTWVVGWIRGKKWGFWVLDPKDPALDRWVESEEYGEKGEERKSWTIDGK